ncbi:MAG TPA: 4-hydroxy-tetrahydrodipicolinate reductase [Phycisphaerales bacterium]|nr:4-hydroxy-tetrahydrodipicolinate reductase [Phycisphaerales bacterium]HCD31018.1 4-hydroxy-tetrahydrodipicolinate reductase [Phycisphaerales bacterium]|tara:strand:+ start:2695 stop:3486 length:792 start_codon:yes stop_codon:yes gene_type:complete
MTRIAIHGAGGRMGRRLVALTHEDEKLTLAGAIEHDKHDALGTDAGILAGVGKTDVALGTSLPSDVDVVIDFALPIATPKIIEACVASKTALVIGTTGLTPELHAQIDEAGKSIAILQAPNMSLGVNLLFALAAQVAKQLGDDYDIEITEAHHRFKRDAPSGTAMGIAQAICNATGKDIDKDLVHGRHGDDVQRKRGEIGMHALRVGSEVGRHSAFFANLGEELELTHKAFNRDVFVHGALKAAKWLAGKPAGRYGMADVLGL